MGIHSIATIPVVIKPTDRILTLCHEGWNRSQVLYQCMRSLQNCFPPQDNAMVRKEKGVDMQGCHGAVSGFDPNKLFQEDCIEEEKYQYPIGGSFINRYIHSQFGETELTAQAFAHVRNQTISKV